MQRSEIRGGVIPDCAALIQAACSDEPSRVEEFSDIRSATRDEPAVKNCRALIFAIPIRSLRTK